MSRLPESSADLEKHLKALEENVLQLRKALQHWRTWDAEYESLKEAVEAASDAGQAEELRRIQEDFDGELVDQKEKSEIFGQAKAKTKEQIVNLLDRRVDYVTRNIETLQKQLGDVERKYTTATATSQIEAADEDDQPITDIVEELDENGNVISYHLDTQTETLSHVRDALEKAGLEEFSVPDETANASEIHLADAESSRAKGTSQPSSQDSRSSKGKAPILDDGVTQSDPPLPPAENAKRVEQIMKSAKDQESLSNLDPVIPDDEDPEDAALRQEMLRYGMGEVGAIVAELELEEAGSDEDDYEFEYSDEDMDDEDDDDKYGRSTSRIVTDDYRQRMLELERKLGIKSRFTEVHKNGSQTNESGSDDERVGRIIVNRTPEQISKGSTPAASKSSIKNKATGTDSAKKGVRFAQDLDIAPEIDSLAPAVGEKDHPVDPLSDVVERVVPPTTVETKSAQRTSRFKAARSTGQIPNGPLEAPVQFLDGIPEPGRNGPEGATIVNQLVERHTVRDAKDTGAFEEDVAFQDVAAEHQRLRRKFIQRQGGFLKEDESQVQRDEEEQEPMSRFKAARLSRQ